MANGKVPCAPGILRSKQGEGNTLYFSLGIVRDGTDRIQLNLDDLKAARAIDNRVRVVSNTKAGEHFFHLCDDLLRYFIEEPDALKRQLAEAERIRAEKIALVCQLLDDLGGIPDEYLRKQQDV